MLKRNQLKLKKLKGEATPEMNQELDVIYQWQISLIKPKNFDSDDPKNFVRLRELSFQNLCNAMEEGGVKDPHSLTTFQFYTKIRYFKEKKKKRDGNKPRSNQPNTRKR
jgi:hypothetical protein